MKRLFSLFCVLLSISCVKKNESAPLEEAKLGTAAKDESVVPTEDDKAKVTRMVKRTVKMTRENHDYMYIETPDDAPAITLVKEAAKGTQPDGKDVEVVEFDVAQWLKDNSKEPSRFKYMDDVIATVQRKVTDDKIPLVVFTGWGTIPEAQWADVFVYMRTEQSGNPSEPIGYERIRGLKVFLFPRKYHSSARRDNIGVNALNVFSGTSLYPEEEE